ncbi:MAG TPA: hypothetical protein VGP55_14840 [Chitinophagaceae bacterium]|nr:hypothetical protein [Chitinophagaceae bacterium]
MQKILLPFLFCFAQTLYGQKPEYIHIEPANIKIDKSIFSEVEVADTRFDTVYMGFVQKGALNRKAPIKLSQSMPAELTTSVLHLIADANKENGTILINIRNFFLSELTAGLSESGTFVFKAGCYLKQDNRYRLMFSVHKTTTVRSGWDVTKKLLNTANEQFGTLVQRAASFDTSDVDKTNSYSFYDIQNIDETEKKLIPVYNVDLPQKGLYASYEDFKNNVPTQTGFIEELNKKTNKPSFFQLKNDNTKGKELSRKSYYAICNGSQLYISTEYGLYPVTKKSFDFYFIGKARETANTATVAMASLMFGILGGMLSSIPDKATFEFRIDHSTGKFLPIKKISD